MLDVCNKIADAAVNGAGVGELTALFARLAVRSVVLLDAQFKVLCKVDGTSDGDGPTWEPHHRWTRHLLRALTRERRPIRIPAMSNDGPPHGCLAVPISLGATTLGHLVVLDNSVTGTPDDADLLMGSYVATLFSLALANERSASGAHMHRQSLLAEALVCGQFMDAEDARRKMTALGLPDATPFVVGVVRATRDRLPVSGPTDLAWLRDELSRTLPGSVVSVRRHQIVAIVPCADELRVTTGLATTVARVLNAAAFRAERRPGAVRLTCGLSQVSVHPDAAPHLLSEAENAIEIGIRIGRVGDVIPYSELGVYRLLLKIGDLRELGRFAHNVLGTVIRHDADHRLDLVHTLTVYLDEGESPKRAAARLGVHANTVTNRLQRVARLTSLNLTNPDDRLTAHLAIKIIAAQGTASQITATGAATASDEISTACNWERPALARELP